MRRQEHIDHLRDLVRIVEENIFKVASHDDLHKVEDTLLALKKRVEDNEVEVKSREARLLNLHSDKFNLTLDVDTNRRARSDFETSNKNLSDVRANYDKLLLEHSRLKSENQALDRQHRDAKADLTGISERKLLRVDKKTLDHQGLAKNLSVNRFELKENSDKKGS